MLSFVSSLHAFTFTLLEFQGSHFKIKIESNYIYADRTKQLLKALDLLTRIEFNVHVHSITVSFQYGIIIIIDIYLHSMLEVSECSLHPENLTNCR